MAGVFRLKQNFTSGVLSPLMWDRTDFERHKNGCQVLENMIVRTQGPTSRRSGFKFIYSLTALQIDPLDPQVRFVDFIFNERQSYVVVMFKHISGVTRAVFMTGDGLVVGTGQTYDKVIESQFTMPESGGSAGDYTSSYPDTYTVNSLTVLYVDTSGIETELVENTDYTYTTVDGTLTLTVTKDDMDGGSVECALACTTPSVTVGDIVFIDMPTDFQLRDFDYAQSADYLYMAQSAIQVHALVRTANDSWAVMAITMTNQPKDWSADLGWPETITFFQQRLAFGGNTLRRQTIWLSRAGDYHNFGREGATLVDSDAVTFTLDSGTQNKIQWLQAVKQLHVGTLGNEWTVSGGSLQSVTPTNVLSLRQTNNGSERIKPLMVGLTTLFVERFARVINEFVFDYQYDSFKTSDITILAPQITEHAEVIAWDYQQTPDSIIWCIMDDGVMNALTYQRQHKVIGWHNHHTQGKFLEVACIPGNQREDDVFVAVEREVGGVKVHYLEKKAPQFKSKEAKDSRFLDSYVLYQGAPASVLKGLGHLEGLEIDVLVDGAVHPSMTVEGGQVDILFPGSDIIGGLGFVSEAKPCVPEIPTEQGTSLTRRQRISHLHVKLYDSLGMSVGKIDEEGIEHVEEQPFRVPTDFTGQALPLYNGVYKMTFMEGFDDEAQYFIRQTQPLPLTITSVVDEIHIEEG